MVMPATPAIDRSVTDVPDAKVEPYALGGIGQTLYLVAQFADEIMPWGSNIFTRDVQLREFYPLEPHLASAVATVASRNASFGYTIDGPPRLVQRAQDMLADAQFGEGWEAFVARVTTDLETQDNGAFIQTIRATDSPTAPVIGISALDAIRCQRTGDPRWPVLYSPRRGGLELLPWWKVIPLAEIPSNIESLFGVQMCAVSRALIKAQIYRDIEQYTREKLGGRNPRAMHFVSGVLKSEMDDAMTRLKERMNNLMRFRYSDPVIVPTVKADATVSVATLELASLPDGFDAQTEFNLYIALLSMAFLVDYQDFAPLPGGNLGTSNQSEILARKSRGKGPGLFRKIFTHKLNFYGVLGNGVTFTFDEQDAAEDQEMANVEKTRAETRKIYVDMGVLSPMVVQQQMADAGEINAEELAMLGQEDATEGLTATDSEEVEQAPEQVTQVLAGLRAVPRRDTAERLDRREADFTRRMDGALASVREGFLAEVRRQREAS